MRKTHRKREKGNTSSRKGIKRDKDGNGGRDERSGGKECSGRKGEAKMEGGGRGAREERKVESAKTYQAKNLGVRDGAAGRWVQGGGGHEDHESWRGKGNTESRVDEKEQQVDVQ